MKVKTIRMMKTCTYKKRYVIFLFAVLIIIVNKNLLAQQNYKLKDSMSFDKNVVKGFAIGVPVLFSIYSLGYERYLTPNTSIELEVVYQSFIDEESQDYGKISIFPGYKYYTKTKYKWLNNFWISSYLSFIKLTHNHKHDEGYENYSLYKYGLGCSIGKRFFHTKREIWFLDLGLGYSFNIYDDEPMFSNNNWNTDFLPRPIIQLGLKF